MQTFIVPILAFKFPVGDYIVAVSLQSFYIIRVSAISVACSAVGSISSNST
jgi:hypothetical protein